MTKGLLVVAGEASGDAFAAGVIGQLDVACFGMGGPLLQAAGLDCVSDRSGAGVMGVVPVLGRLPHLASAYVALIRATVQRTPRAALLVGFSEFNARLGRTLRRRGVRVLWYAPPQIWAWRPERAHALRRSADRLALLLPFEAALWRRAGADAHYVGHPVSERRLGAKPALRRTLDLTPRAEYIALLPGSRRAEVERHLGPMLEAAVHLRRARGSTDARWLIAPGLPPATRRRAIEACRRADIAWLDTDAATALPAFDVALSCSGTATLECAAAGVPPVIVHRVGRLALAGLRRWVQTPHVGLPNILLGQGVFPELVGPVLDPETLAESATTLLDDRPTYVRHCQRTMARLDHDTSFAELNGPSARVRRMLAPWLH